jgi:hypothetical protein
MSYFDTVQSIKRAALYLRVSTDMQAEKFSLPAQEKLSRELASKHGWEIVRMYRDEGFSGSWIEKRPQFSTLLKDAALKKFDAVVVTDFDRLARPDNLKDLGRIQEVFIEHDVKIVTLSDIIDLSDDDQWFVSSLLGIVAAKGVPSPGYKPKSDSGYSDELKQGSSEGSGMRATLGASRNFWTENHYNLSILIVIIWFPRPTRNLASPIKFLQVASSIHDAEG